MKAVITLFAALVALALAAFFGFGLWMFDGESQKRDDAIRIAESLGEARFQQLALDCERLTHGESFSVVPYKDGEYSRMWDEKSGYPTEFRDLKPLRIYVDDDSVTLMTYKCFDESVEIEVSAIRSGAPIVSLIYGDYARPTEKILWKKKPNQALQTTPMTRSGFEKTIVFGRSQRGV